MFYRQVRRKKDKAVQVRQTVRIEMRRLGFLYFELKKHKITKQHNNVQDMFIRDNFDSLRDAIDIYSTSAEGNLKAGLKQNLIFLLKRSAKVIKAIAMSQGKDQDGSESNVFIEVLELWEDNIFGDAQYEINKRRQINLRRPKNLPNEEDVNLIRETIISTMKNLTEDSFQLWDETCFVKLRDAACTRLTLLNAQRGGEPAHMTVTNNDYRILINWI